MTFGYMEAILHKETLFPIGIGNWLGEVLSPGWGCLQGNGVLFREKKQHPLPTEKRNSSSRYTMTRGERTTLEKGKFRTMEIFQTGREQELADKLFSVKIAFPCFLTGSGRLGVCEETGNPLDVDIPAKTDVHRSAKLPA